MAEAVDNLQFNDEQRTRLLALGLERVVPASDRDADEVRGDLLCDILRCPLPPAEHMTRKSKPTLQQFQSVFGPSLGRLLADPETPITVLRRIKEYAKDLGRRAESDTDKEVFLALYFGAIAVALTSHETKITEHSNTDLFQFFSTYASATWVPKDFLRLFCDAARHCQEESQANNEPAS